MAAAFGHGKGIMRGEKSGLFIKMRDNANVVEIGAEQIAQAGKLLGARQQVAQLCRTQHHMIGAALGQIARDQCVKFITQRGADQSTVEPASMAQQSNRIRRGAGGIEADVVPIGGQNPLFQQRALLLLQNIAQSRGGFFSRADEQGEAHHSATSLPVLLWPHHGKSMPR